MSRVVLCTGKRADRPYILKTTGTPIYTIEELCYILKEELDMLDESVIDRDMAVFMETELGLGERGKLLEELIVTKSDLPSRLVAIFCSCDYFSRQEIKEICEELERTGRMSPLDRRRKRADKLLNKGNRAAAMREYRSIISDPGADRLSAESHSAILHNLGVIDAREGRLDSAADFFRRAYEETRRTESLRCYLFALKLGHKDDAYLNEAMRLLDNGAVVNRLENEYAELDSYLLKSGELDDINRLKSLLRDGRAMEFDRLAAEVIEGLKRGYRS